MLLGNIQYMIYVGSIYRWKWTTSGSLLEAREVMVVGVASKRWKEPPPARVWMRGRWWWWQGLRMSFCPGGKVSNSKRGWKIRMAKTSHDKNCGSFFRGASFASSFLPSLGSFLPSQAHIPHERGGASCGRHSGGGRKRRSRSCLVV